MIDFLYYKKMRLKIKGEETRRYVTNSNCEKGKTIPKVTLQGRNITRNGKELSNYYYESFCHRTLKLDETHTLKIEIDEPYKFYKKSEIFVLRNCTTIEDYLLGLDNSLDVAQVYDKLVEFLGFSKEDISNIEKFLINYVETVDGEERTRSKILLSQGKMQEYAIIQGEETFHVFKNGDWEYFSNEGIQIGYLAENKQYSFYITGTENQIRSSMPFQILSNVEANICKLWDFVNK